MDLTSVCAKYSFGSKLPIFCKGISFYVGKLLKNLVEVTTTACGHLVAADLGTFCEHVGTHGLQSAVTSLLTKPAVQWTSSLIWTVLFVGGSLRQCSEGKLSENDLKQQLASLLGLVQRAAAGADDAAAMLQTIVNRNEFVRARLDGVEKAEVARRLAEAIRNEIGASLLALEVKIPDRLEDLVALGVDGNLQLRENNIRLDNIESELSAVKNNLGVLGRILKRPRDVLMDGTSGIVGTFATCRYARLAQDARPCEDHDEVRRAIGWLFVEGGRHFSSKKVTAEYASSLAEKCVCIKQRDFEERAMHWWDKERWTITLTADRNGEADGVCIALPLRYSAYQRVRAGESRIPDCTATEIESPSPYLAVEAVFMRPTVEGHARYRRGNRHLLCAILRQHVRLTNVVGAGRRCPVSLVTAAGNERFGKMLQRFGYKEVGSRAPQTNWKIFERIILSDQLDWSDAAAFAIWESIQRLEGRHAGHMLESGPSLPVIIADSLTQVHRRGDEQASGVRHDSGHPPTPKP